MPVVILSIHGTEVTYHGIMDKRHLINWIIEKTKLTKVTRLKEEKDFKPLFKKHRMFFIFTGEE